jgi:hypothetical protein
MNHQSYLLICNYISNKVSSSEKENNWVKKLRNMLGNNINHLNIKNNKDFEMFILNKNLNNSDLSIPLIEISYYMFCTQKLLTLLLKKGGISSVMPPSMINQGRTVEAGKGSALNLLKVGVISQSLLRQSP